jgi:hypothetical protein
MTHCSVLLDPVLIDLTSVTDFALTVDFVRQCGRDDGEYRPNSPRLCGAFAVRIWHAAHVSNPSGPKSVAIFLDADEAEQWARGRVPC